MDSFQKTVQQFSPDQTDNCGLYRVDIPKRNGYARTGLPLYSFDPMFDFIPTVSLDSSERVFHRITLTRAHTRNKGQAKGCFINGNLAYTAGTGALYDRVTLYNPGEWSSGAKPVMTPHLWFSLGDKQITIIANDNFNKARLLWAFGVTKVPDHYAIYVNDKNIQTGKTKEQQDHDNRFWRYGWTLIFLAPIWLIFNLLVAILSPILAYMKKSEIRMYLVEPVRRKGVESDDLRAKKVSLKYITDPTNRSPLLT